MSQRPYVHVIHLSPLQTTGLRARTPTRTLDSNGRPIASGVVSLPACACEAAGGALRVSVTLSVDNEWADALSRGEERVQDVFRMARALGWTPHRLYPQLAWRDLSGLPRLDA